MFNSNESFILHYLTIDKMKKAFLSMPSLNSKISFIISQIRETIKKLYEFIPTCFEKYLSELLLKYNPQQKLNLLAFKYTTNRNKITKSSLINHLNSLKNFIRFTYLLSNFNFSSILKWFKKPIRLQVRTSNPLFQISRPLFGINPHKNAISYFLKANLHSINFQFYGSFMITFGCTINTLQNYVFICGGFNFNTFQSLGSTFRLNYYNYETRILSNLNFPRHFHASTIYQGDIFAIGGINSDKFSLKCEKYLCTENRWEIIPQLNSFKKKASVIVYHDILFCIGGNIGSSSVIFESLNLFRDDLWKFFIVENIEEGLTCQGLSIYSNCRILIFGGKINNNKSDKCWIFNPITLKLENAGFSLSKSDQFGNESSFAEENGNLFCLGSNLQYIHIFNLFEKKWSLVQICKNILLK